MRLTAFAFSGRTDLARAAGDNFLEETDENGRAVVLYLASRAGVPMSPEARAGSRRYLDEAIKEHLEHRESNSGFRLHGPQ